MRGWIARMHFKRQTMALVHLIFVTYGSKITGNYLDQTWGHNLGRMLREWSASEMKPEEAACVVAMKTIGHVLRHLSEDRKELVFLALRQGDDPGDATVRNIAGHLTHVIAAIHEIAPNETYGDAMIYRILGTLQGRSGEALDDFMGEQLVNKVIRSITDGR
jgi:hypothetical protein